jgi:hypothetical protein
MCLNCLNFHIHAIFHSLKNNDAPVYIFNLQSPNIMKYFSFLHSLIFSGISQNKELL